MKIQVFDHRVGSYKPFDDEQSAKAFFKEIIDEWNTLFQKPTRLEDQVWFDDYLLAIEMYMDLWDIENQDNFTGFNVAARYDRSVYSISEDRIIGHVFIFSSTPNERILMVNEGKLVKVFEAYSNERSPSTFLVGLNPTNLSIEESYSSDGIDIFVVDQQTGEVKRTVKLFGLQPEEKELSEAKGLKAVHGSRFYEDSLEVILPTVFLDESSYADDLKAWEKDIRSRINAIVEAPDLDTGFLVTTVVDTSSW